MLHKVYRESKGGILSKAKSINLFRVQTDADYLRLVGRDLANYTKKLYDLADELEKGIKNNSIDHKNIKKEIDTIKDIIEGGANEDWRKPAPKTISKLKEEYLK